MANGIKGTAKRLGWDLSNTPGIMISLYGDKTFNASIIGQSTPNHFDDGGFRFLQSTTNLDFNRSFKDVAEGLNFGLLEFRYEIIKFTVANVSTKIMIFRKPGIGFTGISDSAIQVVNLTVRM
jgi:iron complex outermembrane receptor protein